MKRSTKGILGALVAYAVLVAMNEQLIQRVPKIARFFAPPACQFSQSIPSGSASPFEIGMSESLVSEAADDANLVARNCPEKLGLFELDYPPSYCFQFGATGVFWDVWIAEGRVAGVHIFTTMNLTSE